MARPRVAPLPAPPPRGRTLKHGHPGRLARAVLSLLGLAGAVTGCARAVPSPVAPPGALAAVVDSVVRTPPLDGVQWGVLAVDAATGRTLLDHRGDTRFIPASNMKIAVAAAALHRLGPDHRFVTSLRAAGDFDPASGVLDGDLVLAATGDPSLSARWWGTPSAALDALADSLRARGLRRVTGELVIDLSRWDTATAVASWMVEDLPSSATGGAFALGEGETTIVVTGADRPGHEAWLAVDPPGVPGWATSRVRTVATAAEAEPLRARWDAATGRIVVDGATPVGRVDTLRVGTRDPLRQAAAALSRALTDADVLTTGGWRIALEPGEPLGGGCATGAVDACGAPALASLASPPLIELVGVTLGESHNWMAEQLVRALGAPAASGAGRAGRPAGTAPPPGPRAGWSTGLAALRGYLVDVVGVDSLDVRLRDGSGLSAQNVLTPRAVVQVLAHALRQPWGDAFVRAMAEPGEEDTTLESRLQGMAGRVFAKTGTLTNVAALSGYVVRPEGGTVIFSILTNASALGASRVQPGIDRIVRALAGG